MNETHQVIAREAARRLPVSTTSRKEQEKCEQIILAAIERSHAAQLQRKIEEMHREIQENMEAARRTPEYGQEERELVATSDQSRPSGQEWREGDDGWIHAGNHSWQMVNAEDAQECVDAHNAALAAERQQQATLIADGIREMLTLRQELAAERSLRETAQDNEKLWREELAKVDKRLLAAQAAVAKAYKIIEPQEGLPASGKVGEIFHELDELFKTIDLTALREHDAKLRSEWEKEYRARLRESWRVQHDAEVRKPLVEALKKIKLEDELYSPVRNRIFEIIDDALAKIKEG